MRKFLLVSFLSLLSFLSFLPTQVQAGGYTLEPSESQITTSVHLPYEGYGVNVLLKQDGQLVMDQRGIRYNWYYPSGIIVLKDQEFYSGCPYELVAPCPNMHADFQAVSPGTVTVEVKAFKDYTEIAKTSFTVTVTDTAYTLEPSESEIAFPVNTGYGVNVLLKKSGYLVLDQQNVTYRWTSLDTSVVTVQDYGMDTACAYDIKAPCPNLHADLNGWNPGKTQVVIEAWIGSSFIKKTLITVTVKPNAPLMTPAATLIATPRPTPLSTPLNTPQPPRTSYPTPQVTVFPQPTPSQKPNYEGERLQRIEEKLDQLNTKVEKQENLLQRIWSFIQNLFKFSK